MGNINILGRISIKYLWKDTPDTDHICGFQWREQVVEWQERFSLDTILYLLNFEPCKPIAYIPLQNTLFLSKIHAPRPKY